ncbi:Ig-like domain-containing protein [Candidatus Desantisbacteria bacterium]|nr:Ig-like domain-containing protein [Candidatus Desantisbacteria bacterium]
MKDIDNKLLDGEVTYNSNSKTVIFILSSTLKYSSCYTAIIKTGVKDLDGNNMFADYTWSFTTLSAPDTIPPAILSTSPLNGESNIPVDVIIGVIFNEKINSATVTAKIFKLYDKDNFPVNGTITVKNNKITFIPSNVLEHYSFYTAVVTAGIKDLSGNSSVSDFTWSFTTNKALTSTTEKKKACFISFLPGSGLVKKFRDEYLMTNIIGKFLVDFYCEILSGLFR